jgi:chromosome segregation ATPase
MDESANQIALRASQPGAAGRTRDLPARTVQDQDSDQRPHASILEGIRKHLEGLEWLVNEVRQHELPGLSSQLAGQTRGLHRELADTRESAPAWAESLPEQLRSISAQTKPIAELPALRAGLGGLSDNVGQLLPRLQDACDMIARASAALHAQEQRLAELARHVDLVGGQVQAAQGRLECLDMRLSGTGEEIGTIGSKLGALDIKLTGTDGRVGALANRIDRLDDHIGDTDDRVGLINERIGSINDRIGLLSGHMAIVDERTAPIDGRLGALETKLIEPMDGRMMPGQRRGDDQG